METINHECYVSLEIAKLLKEIGFKWFINTAYRDGVLMHQGNLLCDNFNGKQYENAARHEFFSAPTLDVAQRWLREVKGIEVYAHVFYDSREMLDEWDVYVYEVNHITKHIEDYISSYDIYHTYEEAQEAGIKKTLELILEKGE